MTATEQKFAELQLQIQNNEPITLNIKGREYKLYDIKEAHFDRIMKVGVPLLKMQQNIDKAESKDFEDIEAAYNLYRKNRNAFAKISSLFLLGHNNFKAFFYHPIYWRILKYRFDASSHYILFSRLVNDERMAFSFAIHKSIEAIVKMRMLMIPKS